MYTSVGVVGFLLVYPFLRTKQHTVMKAQDAPKTAARAVSNDDMNGNQLDVSLCFAVQLEDFALVCCSTIKNSCHFAV